MQMTSVLLLLLACPLASGMVAVHTDNQKSCVADDAKHRMLVQQKLKGVCEEMCKEVGAYPKCTQCEGFVAPDATPGVMTWDELLEHMDNLVEWGAGEIKGWKKNALVQVSLEGMSCEAQDQKVRSLIAQKMKGVCEDMCKEVGAYPKCTQCEGFVAPDATPGVMTWDELLEHMDNLVEWGAGEIKGWKKNALVQVNAAEESCVADDAKHRVQVALKLKGVCEEMCKEVGAYPKCTQCEGFVAPDATPGVMTWDELLEHMDNLVEWGAGEIKGWKKNALIQMKGMSCEAQDQKVRSLIAQKMKGVCEDMCKEVGAYPKCTQCEGFVAPDATPGVMTWDELLEHMDNLVEWGAGEIKGWKKNAFLQLRGSK